MWPSLATANFISQLAGIALVIGLGIAVVGAVLIAWMHVVKTAHRDMDRRQAINQVAVLDAAVAEANKALEAEKRRADQALADANAKAAELQHKADEERHARERIEERLASRTLSPAQAERFVEALSGHAGSKVDVFTTGDGDEVAGLSSLLVTELQLASWETASWVWTGVGSIHGIVIIARNGSPPDVVAAADALSAALNEGGLSSIRGEWVGAWEMFGGVLNGPPFNADRASIRMIVGAKPTQ
jgi:hypothetical protein